MKLIVILKNSFPKLRFDSYPIEFSFFGVIGDEVESRADLADYSCISFTDGFQNCFDTGCSLKVVLVIKTLTHIKDKIQQNDNYILVQFLMTNHE